MSAPLPATSVAYPYALIEMSGGAKLMWMIRLEITIDDQKIYHGHRMTRHWSQPDWRALFKTPGCVDAGRVIASWRHQPRSETVARAAKAWARKQRAAA